MSSNRRDIGRKINDNGWIDFQGNPEWKKPLLRFDSGRTTTFKTSNLKDVLKEFIDVDKTYFFQGIKINPEVDEVLGQFKQYKGKITRFRKHDDSDYQLWASPDLVETYFNALKQKLSKGGIPYISYHLATKDCDSYVPGILSWPTIFIIPAEKHQNLVNKVNSINDYEGLKKIDSSIYTIIHKANIPLLLLDEDTSLEVKGDLVQKMSNLLFTYRAKYNLPNHNDGDF